MQFTVTSLAPCAWWLESMWTEHAAPVTSLPANLALMSRGQYFKQIRSHHVSLCRSPELLRLSVFSNLKSSEGPILLLRPCLRCLSIGILNTTDFTVLVLVVNRMNKAYRQWYA